jgi:two-component system nitrogen regulation response regulator NtrX
MSIKSIAVIRSQMWHSRSLPTDWVLVVEDEASIRDSVRDLLIDEGYSVAVAPTLQAAREKLRREPFTCMLLDLGLPDGTGDELLRDLLDRPDAPAVVVMSTAINASDVAHHYGVLYVVKPFELELVLAAIKVATSQRMRPFIRTREAPTVRLRPMR